MPVAPIFELDQTVMVHLLELGMQQEPNSPDVQGLIDEGDFCCITGVSIVKKELKSTLPHDTAALERSQRLAQ